MAGHHCRTETSHVGLPSLLCIQTVCGYMLCWLSCCPVAKPPACCSSGCWNQAPQDRRPRLSTVSVLLQVVDDILDITQTTEQLGKTAGKDLASSKTTYPSLLGLDRSREIARSLISDAKEALSMYDSRAAAPLLGLADYIGSRTR